jgi:hypothetical protein
VLNLTENLNLKNIRIFLKIAQKFNGPKIKKSYNKSISPLLHLQAY